MDPRTIGQLITGFGAKLLAVGLAIWCACEVIGYVTATFAQINHAFGN
jgi:hypothetical protein